jgi:organic radical activating enzyme
MNKVNTFTSTGMKFLHKVAQDNDLLFNPRPLSLQVALTERCNLRCSFCSVVNREKKFEWDYDHLLKATDKFRDMGIKTVEITGGGEPLMYPFFEDYVRHCIILGLEVGLITNGILLKKVSPILLDAMSWVRISMNCLDYVKEIEIPHILGTLGFSYVYGDDSSVSTLQRVVDLAKEHHATYVRVVPNCLSSEEALQNQHSLLKTIVDSVGEPAFYQQKEYGQSKRCRWCFYKPFLYCNEMVYPCSSIAINPNADKSFEPSYAICHWKDIETRMYNGKFDDVVDVSRCDRCVFEGQNNLIDSLLEPVQHKNFI